MRVYISLSVSGAYQFYVPTMLQPWPQYAPLGQWVGKVGGLDLVLNEIHARRMGWGIFDQIPT